MDKRENVINIAKTYKGMVEKEFPVKIEQFYLFGSYAKDCAHADSDIDIAMIVSHLDDSYNFDTETILWKLRHDIDFRIEPHLIARDEDYSYFVREIERTGIEI